MALENIHNYYEKLVTQRLNDMIKAQLIYPDQNFLEDVACVALNQLPSRYVCYDIDMVYNMSAQEREQIEYEVYKAFMAAVEYVMQHRNNHANSA